MVKKAPGAYWTDEEIREAIEEWKRKRPDRLKTGEWRVEDIPFYEPGRPPRSDLWQRVDYMDEYEMIYGRRWGATGIGKLREVAVVRPTEYDYPSFIKQDSSQLGWMTPPNLDKWQKEHENLVETLRESGVTVHYREFPKPPISAYGPMRGMWAGGGCKVVWGGAIVTRYGFAPLNRGREKVVAQWLVEQGCPILLTVIGKGVAEGAMISLTDDCIIIPRGLAGNQEGWEQVKPVLQRVGITTIVEVHISGWLESFEWPAAGTYHPDMFMMPVDLGKVLIYPAFCGWEMIKWFRENKFELIAVEPDEQRDYIPSNLIILEPGKVIMHAGAKKTIAKVRKAGVEVIDIPYTESLKVGGGIYCATSLQLVRDPGPKLEDMK